MEAVTSEDDGEFPVAVAVGGFEPLLGAGIVQVLVTDPRLRLSGDGLAPEALLAIRSEVAVMVVSAPRFSPAALNDFVEAAAPARVVVMTDSAKEHLVSALLAAGPASCVPTDCSADAFRNAVALSAEGLQVRAALHPRSADLTAAETRVLALLRIGQSNGEIAAALHVSVETVRTHARQIYRKLDVSGRDALQVDAASAPSLRRASSTVL